MALAALLLLCAGWIVCTTARAAPSPAVVEDLFGRVVNARGITLVDRDGYLANPAIQLFVRPPAGAALPGTVSISAAEPRLYFDLPSQVGAGGPSKTLTLNDTTSRVPFYVSIFPDRDGAGETHPLTVRFTDANGTSTTQTLSARVVDQDLNVPGPFQILLDFSQDQTGFFGNAAKRVLLQQIADDWAYFFDLAPDPVAVGAEKTWIWNPDGFVTGRTVTNQNAYGGFLLYAYGIHHSQLRSGGEGSLQGGFQSIGGQQLPLRRSGGVAIETAGNYNQLGWFVTAGDSDWWKSGNLGNELNDLYSIAHHEMGHAIAFNGAYPQFADARTQGFIDDPDVLAYHGANPRIDASDHFDGEVDRESRRGAFGYEYFGDVPARRWLITKLDLLCAQAVGYRLRPTSAFTPFSFPAQNLPAASGAYSHTLAVNGGIPFYDFRIVAGALPTGLSLDPFTGTISGTPVEGGTFRFTVRARDYHEGSVGIDRPLSIVSRAASLASLTLTPTTVAGSLNVTGKVTLTDVSSSSVVVALGSTNPAATVPESVTIPSGATFRSFTLTTQAVSANQTGVVTATLNGETKRADLTVRPISIETLTLSPASVVGGEGRTATGTVTLEGPAGPGSIIATLSSSNTMAARPAVTQLTFNGGERTKSFTVQTSRVETTTAVTLTAAANGLSKTARLTVEADPTPPDPPTAPDQLQATAAALGRIDLSWKDRSLDETGFEVERKEGSPSGSAAYAPIGNTGAGVTRFTDRNLGHSVTWTYRVRAINSGGSSAYSNEATATTQPGLLSLTIRPARVKGGRLTTGTVALTGAAPAGGALVTLASDSRLVRSPATIRVSAGKKSVSIKIKTRRTQRTAVARISATYGGETRDAQLIIRR